MSSRTHSSWAELTGGCWVGFCSMNHMAGKDGMSGVSFILKTKPFPYIIFITVNALCSIMSIDGVFQGARNVGLLHSILCFSFCFLKMYLSDYFLWVDPYFSFIHVVLLIGAVMLMRLTLPSTDTFSPPEYHLSVSLFLLAPKAKGISFFFFLMQLSM